MPARRGLQRTALTPGLDKTRAVKASNRGKLLCLGPHVVALIISLCIEIIGDVCRHVSISVRTPGGGLNSMLIRPTVAKNIQG